MRCAGSRPAGAWTVPARILLVAAGAITALFVARDAPNFQVIEGMVGIAIIAVVVGVLVLLNRRG
ncbi:hypothetical protein DOO78_12735 [Roseicella frigidaeris]|uniref:Uncharacterized protein n=1 Tax=Roseicella frigidaeris TaxID=2230885 RepID=A0A327M5V7_9PROT|nr:hypothetical protein DOO78_12735 [Roseicella frigidaeris]